MTTDAAPPRPTGTLDLVFFAVAAAAAVALWAVVRIVGVFDPTGVPFTLPVSDDPVALTLEGQSAPATQTLTEATVRVPDLDAAGKAFLVASAVIVLLGTVVAVTAIVRLALEFRAGRFFSRRVTRAFTIVGATILGTALLVMLSDAMARRSAMEALGLAYEPLHLLDLVAYAPAWVASLVAGVLAGAFAYGERLQRDVRGLV
ncbi:hypothetical protein R8Z57_12795 [Microbacterium sp. M3]|uniref:DUF2975 domain-containing protein n=1 Tax=Microbacterium arthrosphaerae TaxID=792652 RepID=A0ABU4H2U5_9MICO|nr:MULTISPECIES: hypothetical protein [Microbacterium]MDW4573651.1 hypothetical protein [Microbacterium arthrosphaerae]MDW7607506.1 hypothetical protein [Microbacterium sp. M3]